MNSTSDKRSLIRRRVVHIVVPVLYEFGKKQSRKNYKNAFYNEK